MNIELTEEEKYKALEAALLKKINDEKARFDLNMKKEYERKMLSRWSASEYFDFIKARCKTDLNKELVIDKNNENVIKLLCTYFTGDKFFESKGFSLNKGIYLYGKIGSGKTFLMNVFSVNQLRCYYSFSVRKISNLFDAEGIEAINQFSKPNYYPVTGIRTFNHSEFGRCFDDLGSESLNRNHWGNKINPMQDILYSIYESNIPRYYFHVTSNLGYDEIKQNYGERLASRMKEMFNFIKLSGNDRRN